MTTDDKRLSRRGALAALLMGAAAVGSQLMVPTKSLAKMRVGFQLATLVPTAFGDWQVDKYATAGVVNPQTEAMLNRLYSQLLDRTFVDSRGHRIMVSVAYGDDQSDNSVQMHFPEVCYPAQGFQLKSNRLDQIQLPQGPLKVRRLETEFGRVRFEPVTYWTIVGDRQSMTMWERKLSELRHGLKGEIVDGLLFRVSNIDADTAAAFQLQDRFIQELIAAMTPDARRQLVGLP
jgi:EpsI family protein